MIRFLLCFFFLEVCLCNVNEASSNVGKSFGRLSSADDQHAQRYTRGSASQKKFGETGNYVTTVVYVDLPPFSDSINVDDVFDHADKFNIQYNDVKFSNLSSAYSLGFRIDLSANVAKLIIRLGTAQIAGTYSVTTPSAPNATGQDFVLNLFADLWYTHEILFQVDEKGKATFGTTENHRLVYRKVKGKYTNPPSALADDLADYLNPSLLKAVVAKIHEEVAQKVNLNDVGYHIKNEVSFKLRNYIGERFKKAIADAFENVHENAFNVYYFDKTNFSPIIQNFAVRIQSFLLRDIEGYQVQDMKVSFVGDHVRARVQFVISSPLALFHIVYRDRVEPSAQNKTVRGEFQLSGLLYEVELTANPDTKAIEFGNAAVKISGATVASTQGVYGDERDAIIQQLTPYIKWFVEQNASGGFVNYVNGLLAEGRIAHEVFKY